MDLVTFLRARLDKIQEDAEESRALSPGDLHWSMPAWLDRNYLLADVAAKRRIVDEFGDAGKWLPANRDDDEPEYAYGRARALHNVIKLLAAPFASHPDYDPAWASGEVSAMGDD